ncbi:MAG: hypothetical protein JXR44_00940 [Thiotrichales bacterium]|nr:hypothetical protein [Thiotrichales bacterium]
MALDLLNAGKTESADALFSVVNILNTKLLTGFNNSVAPNGGPLEGANTSNLMDIIGFVKKLPAGAQVIDLVHDVVPGPALVDGPVGLLKSLPLFSALLPAINEKTTEGELGGDALQAVVDIARAFPVTEDVVNLFIKTFVVDNGVAGPLKPVTDLLHEISLGGNLLAGTIPPGSLLASESTETTRIAADGTVTPRAGLDSLDVVVGFAKSLPVVGDVVATVIPDIFPKALGIEPIAAITMPLAGIAHNVLPAYEVTDFLIGPNGVIGSAIGGLGGGSSGLGLDGLLSVGDLLGGGLLGGDLLGGDLLGGDLLGGDLLGGDLLGGDLLGGLLDLDGLLGGLSLGGSASGDGQASATAGLGNLLSLDLLGDLTGGLNLLG